MQIDKQLLTERTKIMPDDVLNKKTLRFSKNWQKIVKKEKKRRKIQRISKKLNISTDFLV